MDKRDWFCRCENCLNYFKVELKWSKFCSKKCRMANWRKNIKLLLIILFLGACNSEPLPEPKSEINPIVGHWEPKDTNLLSYKFNENLSGELKLLGHWYELTYRLHSNRITVSRWDGRVFEYYLKFYSKESMALGQWGQTGIEYDDYLKK